MILKKTILDIAEWLKNNQWIKSVHIMDDAAINALPERTYMEAQVEYLNLVTQQYSRIIELRITISDLTGQDIDYPDDMDVLDAQTKATEILADLAKHLNFTLAFWRNNFPRIVPFKDKTVDRTSGAFMDLQIILPDEIYC